MKKTLLLCLTLLILIATASVAQSVAINTDGSTAGTSALLDVKSTDKGLLIPRMSKAQKNAIASPATGLLVFQNAPDSTGFYYYNGSSWLWLTTTNQQDTFAWKSRGNAGTTTASNFFGTTDNVPLSFRQNNTWLGRWDRTTRNFYIGDSTGIKGTSATNNVAFGNKALQENTTGIDNIAIGANAMRKNTAGSRNTVFGESALSVQSYDPGFAYASDNTAIGHSALLSNQPNSTGSGFKNVAVGNDAMYANTIGSENTVVGVSAMRENTSGSANTAVGRSAQRLAKSGDANSYFGYTAGFSDSVSSGNTGLGAYTLYNYGYTGDGYNTAVGYNASRYVTRPRNTFVGAFAGFGDRPYGGSLSVDSGVNNTGVGAFAMYRIANGTSNTAIGYNALYNDSSGINNTAVGRSVLVDLTTGDYNTAIGYANDVGSGDLDNTTTVGARAYVTQNNSLILGSISGINGATANTAVGIGTTAPTARLDVNGDFKLGVNGTILTEVIRASQAINLASMAVGVSELETITVAGATVGSTVSVSPGSALLDGISISYARVSAANTVEIKFVNAGAATQNQPNTTFYITITR